MNTKPLIIATIIAIAACIACRADALVSTNVSRSIPADVNYCARMDLSAMQKTDQSARLVDSIEQQFGTQIDAIDAFSSLGLRDIDCIWINVAEEEQTLIVLEGRFKTEAILNSPVVTGSRRLVRPGTVIAIEMADEKTGVPNLAVVVNANVIAVGPPHLVDTFVNNFVNRQSDWEPDGQSILKRLAASEAMILVALLQFPDKEMKQKPFLATFVNAQAEINIGTNVTASARIDMQDEGKAAALKDLISGFIGLGLASEIKVGYPDIQAAILDGLQLGTDGRTVILQSGMELDLLWRLLRTRGLQLN